MILDSKNVEYEVIDITEPGKEDEKEFMQGNSTAKNSKYPLPPQIFNEEDYCGVKYFPPFNQDHKIDALYGSHRPDGVLPGFQTNFSLFFLLKVLTKFLGG